MFRWLLVALAGLIGLYFLLGGTSNSDGSFETGEYVYMIGFGLLAALYIFFLIPDYVGRAGTALKHATIWIGLGLALIIGYAYRGELSDITNRVASEILPPGHVISVATENQGASAVRLRRRPTGHFFARSSVDGTTVNMLVDTGASTVVLKYTDASRVGIDASSLAFTVAVSTANGTTYAAPVRLKRIAIGPIEFRDVEALIAKPGNLSESLLGMSFLRRLRSYEIEGDFLTLRG